jgi:hypothetical protein
MVTVPSEYVALSEDKLVAMPIGEVFRLVENMQTKSKEIMQDMNVINEYLIKNTGVNHRG